jgi:glycosyltransferase involved in cell wall biosynthesis
LPYAVEVLASRERERAWRRMRLLPAGRSWVVAGADHAFHRAAERAAGRLGADLLHRHFTYERRWRPELPLVVTLHTGQLPVDLEAGSAAVRWDHGRRTRGVAKALGEPDAVVCVSDHVRGSVLGRLGLADRPGVHVVYNGCAPAQPGPSRAEARRTLGLGRGRVVLFVGRLVPEKRIHRLASLADEGCAVVLLGGGPLEEDLRRDPRLRVLGFQDEAAKDLWLRAADVLAVPSGPFEGNPLVMLEALRVGTPVHGATAAWLPPGLRRFGTFGDDVRGALAAMEVDASRAPALVPSWDDVAGETLAVYRGVLG